MKNTFNNLLLNNRFIFAEGEKPPKIDMEVFNKINEKIMDNRESEENEKLEMELDKALDGITLSQKDNEMIEMETYASERDLKTRFPERKYEARIDERMEQIKPTISQIVKLRKFIFEGMHDASGGFRDTSKYPDELVKFAGEKITELEEKRIQLLLDPL
jgi:CCR4-NOT transcriptional regulation complex NOT5 subunit